MCKTLDARQKAPHKKLEVIKSIKCSQNYHEKREAMGALVISLVLLYLKSK